MQADPDNWIRGGFSLLKQNPEVGFVSYLGGGFFKDFLGIFTPRTFGGRLISNLTSIFFKGVETTDQICVFLEGVIVVVPSQGPNSSPLELWPQNIGPKRSWIKFFNETFFRREHVSLTMVDWKTRRLVSVTRPNFVMRFCQGSLNGTLCFGGTKLMQMFGNFDGFPINLCILFGLAISRPPREPL